MIGYVPAEVEPDGALRSLVNATEAYLDGYYTRMVHASQTAVEITLFDFFRKLLLSHHVSKEKLKGFLENDATYARQLTVLLPLVCGLRNQPGMPRDVLGRLERIRSLRNPALHQGAESGLLQPEAARLLTAAIVAVYYVEMLEQKLAEPSQA